ncbi:hypothetical protein Patl1_16607 [Pistacia atlantica]|uniref:Uncharacterized protein n=1 Tax=Pistacia atlantica TaxID=434234 RepID=A0ACC1BAM5_9ROSI|nr:hypothetical protein Patl1_16607 [Pistacia atlantica]
MKTHPLFINTFSTPFSNPNYLLKKPFFHSKLSSPHLSFLKTRSFWYFHSLRLPSNSNSKVVEGVRFDGPVIDIDEVMESEDDDLVVETCITRTLPPALTLEHGLQSIKGAVEKLKLDPPQSASGVLRFQIAVPPSAKALNWFCCQPESSAVFPVFFLSKEMENPTCKSLYLNQTRGVFGIGTAIYFTHSSSCAQGERSALKSSKSAPVNNASLDVKHWYPKLQEQIFVCRYLSNDSIPVTTYGFMDSNFDLKSSSMKHEAGSFYFFIPQIELNEHEDISILAATLAWSDALHCTFEQTLQSYESSLCQASCHLWPATEGCNSGYIKSALRKLKMVEDKTVQMKSVCINAVSMARRDVGDPMELVSPFSWLVSLIRFQVGHETFSYAKFSCREMLFSTSFLSDFHQLLVFPVTCCISFDYQLDNASEMIYSTGDHANINAVWASLLVEECSRLGLTYFCIAPGSRSSPLAVAASSHPLTTCIACFDERSLAYHAVGYARGSHKPAVIITSSGTAVSNLLPAVVEASQDFVPVLLLTADRPPELQDAGANQAINQVNHFGSFVRFFFSLPAPTDEIPARMVLTTLDSAVHWATSSPYGPVHINCPFREPLDNSPKKWLSSCMKGLDIWMSSTEPFTKYIQVQQCHGWKSNTQGLMTEVQELIQGVNRGLLLVGAIHTEDEIWAALLLAKHLLWPVVADILSGLRLRKVFASFPEIEKNLLFLDHFDHALLSESVKGCMQFDVILQIGSRITSKRISQMLEECFPCSYILVDNHPYRQDPSHFVTHRIQSTIVQFADSLLKVQVPHRRSKWCTYLQTVQMMVAWEISFQICANYSLSEPHVAHVLSEALMLDSALFVGNSMAIRDADMYGRSWTTCTHTITDMMLNSQLPYHWIRVAGNRGASGIDGLLSTAVGFAVGCNRQVSYQLTNDVMSPFVILVYLAI